MFQQKIIAFLTNNIVPILSVTILTGATVSTSLIGVSKVTGNFGAARLQVPETSSEASSSSTAPSVTPIPSPARTFRVILPPLQTSSTVSQGSSSPATDTTGRCIITLFGSQYDVTSLQSSHSGGNVFVCGADQTALYQSQHGSNLDRMKPYLVTSNKGTTSSSVQTTVGNANSASEKLKNKDREDSGRDQDQEEEDRVHAE